MSELTAVPFGSLKTYPILMRFLLALMKCVDGVRYIVFSIGLKCLFSVRRVCRKCGDLTVAPMMYEDVSRIVCICEIKNDVISFIFVRVYN